MISRSASTGSTARRSSFRELARAAIAARVTDLADPTTKMSKSAPDDAPGVIRMLDGPDVIRRKIARARDRLRAQSRATTPSASPGVQPARHPRRHHAAPTRRGWPHGFGSYGELKGACADAWSPCSSPIQRRHAELMADPDRLEAMLATGADRAPDSGRDGAGQSALRHRPVTAAVVETPIWLTSPSAPIASGQARRRGGVSREPGRRRPPGYRVPRSARRRPPGRRLAPASAARPRPWRHTPRPRW